MRVCFLILQEKKIRVCQAELNLLRVSKEKAEKVKSSNLVFHIKAHHKDECSLLIM